MVKPRTSCWTCSLRHKKCDDERPVCRTCLALEIRCHNGPDRPSWMDGADRESSMRQEIQEDVRRKARRRRHRAQLQRVIRDMAGCDGDEEREPPTESDVTRSVPSTVTPSSSTSTSHNTAATEDAVPPPPTIDPFSALGRELELSTIMSFLDCVLPTILPLYRPSLAHGGRGWLLVRVMRSEALRHIIVSLTSHFFSSVPVLDKPERRLCESWAVREFQRRTVQALGRVQRDIGDPSHWQATLGVGHHTLLDRVHLLESIVHLLLLEVFGAHTERWEMHLDAALMLFRQILDDDPHPPDGILDGPSDSRGDVLEAVWVRLGLGAPDMARDGCTPWNAEQAAFHFSASILVAADVISSVSSRRRPQLRHLHPVLLPNDGGPIHEHALQVQDILGCSNAVLLLLSDVAALDEWKRAQRAAGALSIAQLAARGAAVEESISHALVAVEDAPCPTTAHDGEEEDAPPLVQYLDGALGRGRQSEAVRANHAWLLATRILLHVVLSGWQPLSSVVVASVGDALRDLQAIPSRALPAAAWPFCVVGCLVQPGQRDIIRQLHRSVGATADFGVFGVAMAVTEAVWRRRDVSEEDTWDLSACMDILGYGVLIL